MSSFIMSQALCNILGRKSENSERFKEESEVTQLPTLREPLLTSDIPSGLLYESISVYNS